MSVIKRTKIVMRFLLSLCLLFVTATSVHGWWEIGNVNQIFAIPPINFTRICLSAGECFSYVCNNRGVTPYVALRWRPEGTPINISKVYQPNVMSTACIECGSSYGLYNFSISTNSYVSKTDPLWGNVCAGNSITCSFLVNLMQGIPNVNTIIFQTITNSAPNLTYPVTTNAMCSASSTQPVAASIGCTPTPTVATTLLTTTGSPSSTAAASLEGFMTRLYKSVKLW